MNDNISDIVGAAVDVQDDAVPAEFSDEALALSFAEQYATSLRYVATWGRWLSWDGTRWQKDETYAAFDKVRAICRRASAEMVLRNKTGTAKKLASAQTVTAVERLAKSDRRIIATVDQWDADLMLLNTPGGVVDLKTGVIRPARPDDYMTKCTSVAPDGSCPTPVWGAFLKKIVVEELAAYLRRVFGYSLTGSIKEHAMFFFYGLGDNGKSVLIETISGIIGDYHVTSPIETFMATDRPQHLTELANLRGARLVTASETDQGRHWAESRIKMLTGGDPVSARFMRQDLFEYKPQLKLVIYGNFKPALRSVNRAIRRRMNMVPFEVTITEAEKDKDLAEKLKVEWPGILQQLIDGCIEWQKIGSLNPPKVVTDATEKYLAAEDKIEAWLEERCKRDPNFSDGRTKLFASWRDWAERAKEEVGTATNFYNALVARGFKEIKIVGTRKFKGIELHQEPPPEDDVPPVGRKPENQGEIPF